MRRLRLMAAIVAQGARGVMAETAALVVLLSVGALVAIAVSLLL